MPKLPEYQYTYKKVIGFTKDQFDSLNKLKRYDVNINQFIRSAIREKIGREWDIIKRDKIKSPF